MPKTKLQPEVCCRKCGAVTDENKIAACEICECDVCPRCRSERTAFRHPNCEDVSITEAKIYPA